MADVTITAAEVGLLDALPGGLLGLGVHYAPATVPVLDPEGAEIGRAGQDHGTLEAFTDAPEGALDTAAQALAQVRAAAPARALKALSDYAAAKRFVVETGGIAVNGASVDTSRDSQGMIGNAFAYVTASGAQTVRFKSASGWITLSADQVKALALAVGAHVQAAFAVEDDLDAGIHAVPPTITTTVQIDAAAWPANAA